MKLYHYTSTTHLPRIMASGVLKVTESNLSMHRRHAGPDVVWLSSEPAAIADQDGLTGSSVDKTTVRITVEIDDAQPWLTWSRRRGITKKWAAALEHDRRPATWYVVPRQIPREQWISVEVDGVVVWPEAGELS